MGHITPELFQFLTQLKRHNDRAWFARNKQRYLEDVQEPVFGFIADAGGGLRKISTNLVADPRRSGGSMFRIYRDTRFSKDESPYKTAVGIRFPHRSARDKYAPGFYLHLEPGDVFILAGIAHADTKTTTKIREAIVDRPAVWRKAVRTAPFSTAFELSGDSLSRPPRGFDPQHPLVEDLKRKDFVGIRVLDERTATSDLFLSSFLSACRDGVPLLRFLCDALGLQF